MSERSVRKAHSWREVVALEEAQLKTAKLKAGDLRGIDENDYNRVAVVRKNRGTGESVTIVIDPTKTELVHAPLAMQRVMEDLGITQEDETSFLLKLSPIGNEFSFAFLPHNITEERYGIALSTQNFLEVIAPIQTFESPVKAIPSYLSHALTFHAADTMAVYQGFQGQRQNPHMVEILTVAVDWGTSLLDARRKPSSLPDSIGKASSVT